CDGMCTEIVVALQQTLNGAVEAPFGKASHHKQVVAQRRQCLIECSKNVLRYNHCGSHFLLFIKSRRSERPRLEKSSKSPSDVVFRLFLVRIGENFRCRPNLDE